LNAITTETGIFTVLGVVVKKAFAKKREAFSSGRRYQKKIGW
jgi:hypothetical protein